MKIDNLKPVSTIDIYHSGTGGVSSARDSGTAHKPDRIEISPQARQIQALKKAVAGMPELRQEKVALMKQQMDYGPYKIDAGLVAASIWENYGKN